MLCRQVQSRWPRRGLGAELDSLCQLQALEGLELSLFWVHSARRTAGVWVRGRSVASRPFRSPVLIGPASSQRGSPGSGWGSPPAPGLPLPLPTPPTGAHRVTRPARPHLVWFKVRLPGGGGGGGGGGAAGPPVFPGLRPQPISPAQQKTARSLALLQPLSRAFAFKTRVVLQPSTGLSP